MVNWLIEDTFLLILIFQAILITFIEFLFLYKAFRLKLGGLSWFYAIFGVSLIRVILEILAHIYITVPKNYDIKNYKYAHFIFYAISLLILFYFVELLEHPSPRFFPSAIILFLFGAFISSYVIFLFVDTNLSFHRDIRYTFDIMQIIILGKASLVYYRIHKRALYDSLRSVTLWFFISIFSMAIFSVIEFMEHFYSYLSPASSIFSIFFLMLACLFLYKPYYVYLVPFKIDRLMLYDENSFLIYSCRLENSKKMDEIEIIFGGAMNNMEKSIQSIFETDAFLKKVELDDKSLIIIKKGKLKVIALVEKQSYILNTAMKNFLKELERNIPSLVKSRNTLRIEEDTEEKIVQTITRCFPFIQASEVFRSDASQIKLS